MPNQVNENKELIKNYKVGQVLSPQQVQNAALYLLTKKDNTAEEKALLDAYNMNDVRRIDEVAYKGEMLKKRQFLSMKLFNDMMASKFGTTWMKADSFGQAVNNVLALPNGKEQLEQAIAESSGNPLFHLGLSTIAHMGEGIRDDMNERKGYHELLRQDKRITTKLMETTLEPLTEKRKEKLRTMANSAEKKEQMKTLVRQNDEQQLTMAKFFLTMQMGGVKQREQKRGEQVVGETTMADIVAHGGRLVVTLPTGAEQFQDNMLDSIVGENRGKASGMKERSVATHDIKAKEVGEDGRIIRNSHETNPKLGAWSDNYGMNFAAGGLGNHARGAAGTLIMNDGTAGHCYIKMSPGSHTKCGQMLIGFETSEPGKANNYGLKHDWHARSAPQSSFFADKNAPGIKHDGREVDLSNMSPEGFASVMNRFEQRYRELQKKGDVEKLKQINSMLVGKRLSNAELTTFLSEELGFSKNSAEWLAMGARYALNTPDKNLSNDERFIPTAEETVINPAMNRVCGEELADPPSAENPKERVDKALASKAKCDEMARQMKDLKTSKIGINSGKYNKLVKAAEELQRDMNTLANGNLSQIERSLLVSKIENENKKVNELAGDYVATRGKGKEHPSFSSEWGDKRYYSARSIKYLTEKMQKDLEAAREKLRTELPEAMMKNEGGARNAGNGGGAAHEAQAPHENAEAVRNTNVNAIADKVGAPIEQPHEDFAKKRQEHAPVQPAVEKVQGQPQMQRPVPQ